MYNELGIFKGITTNPSILLKESLQRETVMDHFKEKDLENIFLQVEGKSFEEMEKDYYNIKSSMYFNRKICFKVPITINGLKLIRKIKRDNPDQVVLGTAIYSTNQGILGAKTGCDYLAFYVNRMESNHINPFKEIESTRKYIDFQKLTTMIMGASFKNTQQVVNSFNAGAHTVTISPDIIESMLVNPLVEDAVEKFEIDSDKLEKL